MTTMAGPRPACYSYPLSFCCVCPTKSLILVMIVGICLTSSVDGNQPNPGGEQGSSQEEMPMDDTLLSRGANRISSPTLRNDLLHTGLKEAAYRRDLLPVCYVCKTEQSCYIPSKQQGTRFCKDGCKTVYGSQDKLQVLYKSCGNPGVDGGEAPSSDESLETPASDLGKRRSRTSADPARNEHCQGYRDEQGNQPKGFVCYCSTSLCNNAENMADPPVVDEGPEGGSPAVTSSRLLVAIFFATTAALLL